MTQLAADALGVDGAGRGGREVAGSRSGERTNRWREFLTGRFYGTFQEDVVPVRFASDDERKDAGAETARAETARATAEDETRTVPANGRFANGFWVVGPEGGDDGASGFDPSSEGEDEDEDDVRETTR